MKYIKVTLFLLLVAFLTTDSFAQKQNSTSVIDSLKKRIEKLEKDVNSHESQISSTESKSNFAYGKAVEAEEKLFWFEKEIWWISYNWLSGGAVILGLILGFFGTKEYMKRKAKERIDEYLKNDDWATALNDKIEKYVAENKLRENAKIIVINHEETSISRGFEKVLSLYPKFNFEADMMNIPKLSDVLAMDKINRCKDADLVIIENQDTFRQWKIGADVPSDEFIKLIAKDCMNTPDKLEDTPDAHIQNQAIIISLINQICDKTALVYYGPGVLQSIKADADKQHIIAFANSPSTLYSNVMNLLKFKDILENQK